LCSSRIRRANGRSDGAVSRGEKELSLEATAAIGGKPARRQITLNELRSQAPQTNRRKSSSAPRADQPAMIIDLLDEEIEKDGL